MSNTRIYWIHTLSPTHVGIGRGMGYIDLPIDRDGVTGWPVIRASAFKGVWADYYRATDEARQRDDDNGRLLRTAFGRAGDENSNAGALVPTDAQLVCLPIRSFRGTFAWCTSPLCLRRLHRLLTLAGAASLPAPPPPLDDGDSHHADPTALVEGSKIYLEDLDFQASVCPTATEWADTLATSIFPGDPTWQDVFKQRFAVIPDSAFDFFCQTGTEVYTRVRIDDETKTVAEGALWTEEALPAETILAGIVQCERVFLPDGKANHAITESDLVSHFATGELSLQIGGKATVGRGQVICRFREINGGTN